ncbi:msf1-like conserved region domain-containing protein [Cyclospora cayetanensis]|uniref:Msf1-like conserved region domain-containing protein n=1 Tax=Cyclospora cayetanensis TaxID=88456 RepID=A0A1D3D548_9EIME|nr:msf1-like conserved region domain-containing protein [Cyclospora cayetanensis]
MRLFQKEHVFKNDWDAITSAFWVKYPNELQPHVLRVDTLDLQIDSENQQFVCHRLLSLRYQCPKWVQKFFGASPIGFAFEEATCSLKERKLTLRSCNYTFASFFRVEESCEYTPHPENPQHTLYKQTATYKVSGLGLPVNRAVENVCVVLCMPFASHRAAVAQAAEKSLLGVSVVERLGVFLAEQQWRERCSNCLLSLEEAAASASKHAQEKYRQLRMCVEQKLRVGCPPSEVNRSSSAAFLEPTDDFEAQQRARETCGRTEDGILTKFVKGTPVSSAEHSHDSLEQQAPASAPPGGLHAASFSHTRIPLRLSSEEALSTGSAGNGGPSSAGTLRSDADASNSNGDVECPCGLNSPSGRQPAPTGTWKEFKKPWREPAFADFKAEATYPASSSLPTASRSGAIDFPLTFMYTVVKGISSGDKECCRMEDTSCYFQA